MNRISFFKAFSVALLLFVGSSCGRSRQPKNLLPEQTMVDLLYESYLFEGYSAITTEYDYGKLSSETVGYYEALFKKYNITQAQFDSSVDYYMRNRRLYEDIYNQVISRLDSLEGSML